MSRLSRTPKLSKFPHPLNQGKRPSRRRPNGHQKLQNRKPRKKSKLAQKAPNFLSVTNAMQSIQSQWRSVAISRKPIQARAAIIKRNWKFVLLVPKNAPSLWRPRSGSQKICTFALRTTASLWPKSSKFSKKAANQMLMTTLSLPFEELSDQLLPKRRETKFKLKLLLNVWLTEL